MDPTLGPSSQDVRFGPSLKYMSWEFLEKTTFLNKVVQNVHNVTYYRPNASFIDSTLSTDERHRHIGKDSPTRFRSNCSL